MMHGRKKKRVVTHLACMAVLHALNAFFVEDEFGCETDFDDVVA